MKQPGGWNDNLLTVSCANLTVGGQYFALRAHGYSSRFGGQFGMKLNFCVVSNSIGTKIKEVNQILATTIYH